MKGTNFGRLEIECDDRKEVEILAVADGVREKEADYERRGLR